MGDYSREAIILNISVKGRRLIEGRLLFEEIRYKGFSLPLLLTINVLLYGVVTTTQARNIYSKLRKTRMHDGDLCIIFLSRYVMVSLVRKKK